MRAAAVVGLQGVIPVVRGIMVRLIEEAQVSAPPSTPINEDVYRYSGVAA